MSDTIETKGAETEKASETVVDVKALAEQLEQIKKAQAGSDRAFQEASKRAVELATENEKLKKEKMSEKERAEFEFAKKNAELEAKSREVAEATLRLSKMKLMGEKGVSMEYADYITGTTDEEIARNIETFNKRLEKLVGERVEEKLKGTPKPKSGDPSGGKVDMSHMSLKELNKLAAVGKL